MHLNETAATDERQVLELLAKFTSLLLFLLPVADFFLDQSGGLVKLVFIFM